MSCFYDTTPELQTSAADYIAAFSGPQAAVTAMRAAAKAAAVWISSSVAAIPQNVIDLTGAAKDAILAAGMDAAAWTEYQLALWNLSNKRVAAMEPASIVVDPTGYTPVGGQHITSSHAIGDAFAAAPAGSLVRMAPGLYGTAAGSWKWNQGTHVAGEPAVRFRGACDPNDLTKRTVIARNPVGGSSSVGWAKGQGNVEFEDLEIIGSDLSAVSMNDGCLPHFVLRRAAVHGGGDAYDPAWGSDPSVAVKWGFMLHQTADWLAEDVDVYSIIQEHAYYPHNIQGDYTLRRGSAKHCGRTAIQFFNRMNEGPEGKGDITIEYHDATDVCIGDMGLGGGTAYTFAGGMPQTDILLKGGKTRLGCDPLLALPFQKGITGAIVCYSSPETGPGKGDMAYPGGQNSLTIVGRDIEIGTVYPGSGSAVRPAIDLTAVNHVTIDGMRLKVTRAAGTHNIGLRVRPDFTGDFRVISDCDVDAMVQWMNDPLYASWAAFKSAHPELFIAPWI
jgi:hypothetical protein